MKYSELLEKAVQTAARAPDTVVRIWGSSPGHCRRVFDDLKKRVVADTNSTMMRLTLSNRSEIRIANSERAPMYRGERTDMEIVLLPEWVEDVARPCLFDTGGSLLVESD